jgi:hypothetical protein
MERHPVTRLRRALRTGTRQRRQFGQARPAVEALEARTCPSVFYDFDVIAQVGQAGLTDIEPDVSINDSGRAAFVGHSGSSEGIYVGDGRSSPLDITGGISPSPNFYPELQINNSGQVGAASTLALANLVASDARIYDSNSVGVSRAIGVGTAPRVLLSNFSFIHGFTSISNDGKLAFAGLNTDLTPRFSWIYLNNSRVNADSPPPAAGGVTAFPANGTFPQFRMMAADGNRVVVSFESVLGGVRNRYINLYNVTGSSTFERIAATAGGPWRELGIRPAISDDGTVVVFVGDRGNGRGVFASVLEPGGSRTTVLIAGEANLTTQEPDLGYDAAGSPIAFGNLELDSRPSVAVYQTPGGDPGAIEPGESIVVSFVGTPNQASRTNPITGRPLFFSAIPFAARV